MSVVQCRRRFRWIIHSDSRGERVNIFIVSQLRNCVVLENSESEAGVNPALCRNGNFRQLAD